MSYCAVLKVIYFTVHSNKKEENAPVKTNFHSNNQLIFFNNEKESEKAVLLYSPAQSWQARRDVAVAFDLSFQGWVCAFEMSAWFWEKRISPVKATSWGPDWEKWKKHLFKKTWKVNHLTVCLSQTDQLKLIYKELIKLSVYSIEMFSYLIQPSLIIQHTHVI